MSSGNIYRHPLRHLCVLCDTLCGSQGIAKDAKETQRGLLLLITLLISFTSFSQSPLTKKIPVSPLSIIDMHGYVKSTVDSGHAFSFIRFYDSTDRLLLENKNPIKKDTGLVEMGFYTESPPYSGYAIIGIEKDSSQGELRADSFQIKPTVELYQHSYLPQFDFTQYMVPFWKSDTIYNETVLLYTSKGKLANGRLLFQPRKIISVKSFDQKILYRQGKDYSISGRLILRPSSSQMPFRADTSFNTTDNLAWYDLQNKWITVTYIRNQKWMGPLSSFQGRRLPATISKLRSGKGLTIVAYGTSITRGMNVSGYDTIAPYMPSYAELFTRQLRKKYNNQDIRFYNAALPGATVTWAAKYAVEYINPLKPDIVLIDFGMNDFWRLSPSEFKTNIIEIIDKIKKANPHAEFILVSNMKFDPDYVLDSDPNKKVYTSNMIGYNKVLQAMQTSGIVNLDMTSISDYIYKRKKARDCIANPLHPNDYMARWYAQGLSALFIP